MGDRSRRHDFLPQLVLRGLGSGEHVTTVDLSSKRSFSQNVDKAAAQNGWNTLRFADGHPSDEAKRAGLRVDRGPGRSGPWTNPRRQLDRERARALRPWLFIPFQMLRVPRHREQTAADTVAFFHQ